MTDTSDHPRIWLEPRPPEGVAEDRTWCKDDVWTGTPECEGTPPTEYVRADFAGWQPIATAPRDRDIVLYAIAPNGGILSRVMTYKGTGWAGFRSVYWMDLP